MVDLAPSNVFVFRDSNKLELALESEPNQGPSPVVKNYKATIQFGRRGLYAFQLGGLQIIHRGQPSRIPQHLSTSSKTNQRKNEAKSSDEMLRLTKQLTGTASPSPTVHLGSSKPTAIQF